MEPLSGLDAFFLYLETDEMHMHVAMTAVLDPEDMPDGYSFERLRDHIADRVHLVPPFTKKLVNVPFQLHHPYWVDDPSFNIINHVRHVALPAPGGPEELGRMTGDIASTQLDRRRPLWELWIIEGLADGNIALVAKVHHSAIDGVSGAELFTSFFDLQREPTPVEPPPTKSAAPPPNEIEVLRSAAEAKLRAGLNLGPLARRTVRAVDDIRRNRRGGRAPGGTPLTAPRTHFNCSITSQRNVAFAHVGLSPVKQVKDAFGCTVNDVILATTAGALRRYFEERGDLPTDPLLAVCPVSVRTAGERGEQNNRLSAMFTSLCTHIDDPAERLRAISRTTKGAKVEHEILGPGMLKDWAEVAEPSIFNAGISMYGRMKLADRHRPIHDLLISNVPGPDFPVYMAGAELVRAYPMGPVTEGAGLNVTVMSYRSSVDFGFMVCRDAVPDVWDLARAVRPAFEELEKVAADL
ncbi:MAG: wax ester/triacylglycerol synthase family O-acyltransferase [Acidimicrobiia bacterium]|nr:wax ester/triacylglycerol synthase family O-acyltransferase [Acidimicrobiia bacterium]